jgi:hypothetical protein
MLLNAYNKYLCWTAWVISLSLAMVPFCEDDIWLSSQIFLRREFHCLLEVTLNLQEIKGLPYYYYYFFKSAIK